MIKEILRIVTLPDKILVLALIFLTVTSLFYLRAQDNRIELEIMFDNQPFGVFDMQVDQLIEIREGITVEIADGKVRMLESVCANQICVNQGYSNRVPVICAPERIALIIKRQRDVDIMITR